MSIDWDNHVSWLRIGASFSTPLRSIMPRNKNYMLPASKPGICLAGRYACLLVLIQNSPRAEHIVLSSSTYGPLAMPKQRSWLSLPRLSLETTLHLPVMVQPSCTVQIECTVTSLNKDLRHIPYTVRSERCWAKLPILSVKLIQNLLSRSTQRDRLLSSPQPHDTLPRSRSTMPSSASTIRVEMMSIQPHVPTELAQQNLPI